MNNATNVHEVSESISFADIEAKLNEFNNLGESFGLRGMIFPHNRKGEFDIFISRLSRMSGYFDGQILCMPNDIEATKHYMKTDLAKKENEVALYIYAKFGDKDAIAMIAALNNKLT
jgi:hypothetical protein